MISTPIATVSVITAFVASANAGFLFSFEGTVVSGSSASGDLTGQAFTFSIMVDDVSTDLTPTSTVTSFSIASLTMTVGGTSEVLTSGFDPSFSALFIDPGSTQLVGAQNLFGGDATFMIGALLPDGSFADLGNVDSTGNFTLSGVGSTASRYDSSVFDSLSLELGGFGFQNTATAIPLPTPALLAGAGLAGLVVGRRRSR